MQDLRSSCRRNYLRVSLFRFDDKNRLRPFDGAKSFSHWGASRDEPHALAESFAFTWGLAGVPVSRMNRGAVAAQTDFSRRLRHVPTAFRIPRGPLLALRLGLVHETPPSHWLSEKLNLQPFLLHPAPLAFRKLSPFNALRFNSPGSTRRVEQTRSELGMTPRSSNGVEPEFQVQSDGSKETAGCC